MASAGQPLPDQQGQGAAPAPGGGAPPTPPPDQGTPDPNAQQQQGPPSQAPANPMQMLLAKWYQTVKQIAASDPRLAPGAEKVSQGIQEMQTALVTPPQPTPVSQQPQY